MNTGYPLGVYQRDTWCPFQLGRTSLIRLNYIFMLDHCGIHKVSIISLYYLSYTNKTAVDSLIGTYQVPKKFEVFANKKI